MEKGFDFHVLKRVDIHNREGESIFIMEKTLDVYEKINKKGFVFSSKERRFVNYRLANKKVH